MYLAIKKKDSVTSILLFIFNVFLSEQGIRAVPLRSIFTLLQPFQKNETAIRMGLSRAVQNGLLINRREDGEVYYHLTERAVRSFEHWRGVLECFERKAEQQRADWNGEWTLAVLDVDQENQEGVAKLQEALQHSGFGMLNSGAWVSPYDLNGIVADLAGKNNVGKAVYLFRGPLAAGRPPGDLVNRVWPVEALAQKYARFEEMLAQALGDRRIESFTGGEALPFLHHYGFELFAIIQDDPQLPLELLPGGWGGIRAFESFMRVRRQLLPGTFAHLRGQGLGL